MDARHACTMVIFLLLSAISAGTRMLNLMIVGDVFVKMGKFSLMGCAKTAR
jgi:ribulose 1,5-bisphosphate synthetase/thiazole synthase